MDVQTTSVSDLYTVYCTRLDDADRLSAYRLELQKKSNELERTLQKLDRRKTQLMKKHEFGGHDFEVDLERRVNKRKARIEEERRQNPRLQYDSASHAGPRRRALIPEGDHEYTLSMLNKALDHTPPSSLVTGVKTRNMMREAKNARS